MPPTAKATPLFPTPHNLLSYNSHHSILICLPCQYAIQKSAIQSHLLRHKIYRGDRQRLLSSIATLDLLEPEDVPLPEKGSKPIDGLPVIRGYACKVGGCGNLCVSVKRMRRHWGEAHAAGRGEGEGKDRGFEGCARAVELQTFFRGTKLRYFEVRSSEAGDTEGAGVLVTTDGGDGGRDDEQERDVAIAPRPPPPLPRVPTPPRSPPRSSPVDFDLETLTYFHHFTTTTSLTLPCAALSQSATRYWQTDVVHLALQRRWLMCGLLATAACHLVTLAVDTKTSQIHCDRSAQFFSKFSAGQDEASRCEPDVKLAEGANKAGRRMMCILRCVTWALGNTGLIQEPAVTSQLQSFMMMVRDFVDSDFDFRYSGVRSDDSDGHARTFAQAGRILEMRSSSNSNAGEFLSTENNNTRSALFDRLDALPSRMAEAFGKPEDIQDVFAALSAIAALVECCETSFASDEAGAAFWAMATWLNRISERFNQMVAAHCPATLVVVAHWAALLVMRAEHCGCWFLRGSMRRVLLLVAERLRIEDCAVQSLVGGLMV